MKKIVLTLCLFTLAVGGLAFGQSSRSARSADDDADVRSRSRSRSEKKLTRSEKKALEKAKKQQVQEEKKQKAELEKARKQQEKEMRAKQRAQAKAQRRLERKAHRSLEEEEFASRKLSKKQIKKQEKKKARSLSRSGAHSKITREEHPKERVARIARSRSEERSAKRSAKRSEVKRSAVKRSEKRSAKRSAVKVDTRKIEREQRKLRERQEKEERKRRAALKHEEKNQERIQRLADLRAKELRKKDEHRAEHERRAELARQLALKERKRVSDQADRLAFVRQDRAEKMHRWTELRGLDLKRDFDGGRYADLYKAPSWPVASWFFENKDLLNVSVNYKYATDAYADDRRRFDVTGIEFGYQPIQLQDISLASKLINDGKLTYAGSTTFVAAANAAAAIETARGAAAGQQLTVARAAVEAVPGIPQSIIVAANTAGLVDGNAVAAAIGNAALPAIIATANAATAAAVNPQEAALDVLVIKEVVGTADAAAVNAAAKATDNNAAMQRLATAMATNNYLKNLATQVVHFNGKTEEYGTSIDFARYVMGKNVALGVQIPVLYRHNTLDCDFAYIKDLLLAKGIREMGGSATGLGDVALFANVQTGARTFEKVLGGLKVTFPTGKKTTTAKLWAPELGTGHTQFSAYASMLMDYNRLLNPHVYIEGIYSMAAHQDKRIPVKVQRLTAGATGKIVVAGEESIVADDALVGNNVMALGDRVKTSGATLFGPLFDTSIKGLGDKVVNVRMLRGLEFKARVGNIIEKFILRRGFLDLYYDLHAKFKDGARGLNNQDYNLDILADRTNVLEHKIGTEFTYQFDPYARWRVGAVYTFAGMNAPKTFEISSALGYSF